jgi:hypothetical protein
MQRFPFPTLRAARLACLALGCAAFAALSTGCSQPPAPVESSTTNQAPHGEGAGASTMPGGMAPQAPGDPSAQPPGGPGTGH